jgi:dihydrofolate reductase
MMISLIAAHNLKRVIGKDGAIPWHLPEDLKRFKELTIGNTVLMGRRTFDSVGKILPERRNIILSRRSASIEGAEIFSSIGHALDSCVPNEHIFVIGGGEVFKQILSIADELKLTVVNTREEGDVYFPEYESLIGKEFQLVYEEEREGFTYRDLVRISSAGRTVRR